MFPGVSLSHQTEESVNQGPPVGCEVLLVPRAVGDARRTSRVSQSNLSGCEGKYTPLSTEALKGPGRTTRAVVRDPVLPSPGSTLSYTGRLYVSVRTVSASVFKVCQQPAPDGPLDTRATPPPPPPPGQTKLPPPMSHSPPHWNVNNLGLG